MPRRLQPKAAKLSVRIRRGQDFYWQTIRALDKRGPWTVNDVDAETTSLQRGHVSGYIQRLVRGGFVKQVGSRPLRTPKPEKLYRLLKSPADAPNLRRDGVLRPMPANQRMWNAMRSLKQFDAVELAHVSSIDGAPVPLVTAEAFSDRLAVAGYLAIVVPGRPHHRALYRLKPAMNTGPLAPMMLRAHIVFDVNRNEVIGGDNVEATEVAP